MKTFKLLYNKVLLVIMITMLFSSCERDNPDPGGTATENMAGEWWVQWDGLPGVYFHFATYNTSANSSSEMWLDDQGTFWSFNGSAMKGKVNINISDLTFSGANISSDDPAFVTRPRPGFPSVPITFTITEGKIIKGGTKGPVTGKQTDSIYFKAEFSDDPGTIYILSGYARTRFSEDDH
ncbi:lipid-binding protein [Solitalea lacus]|uniref:lipid-binding protein n=1 Tax=Solitalea lacus TaxID=2911172 RepID=UPI001EDACFD1|nr:lipid-binding protein [Solitalea lacus]UKJ07686.1 hypothetical protein L2B55_00640 [Solitalea lacus]